MDADQEYPSIVVFAVRHLMDLHAARADITDADIDKAVGVARALYPEVLDDTRARWLRRDTEYVLDDRWDALKDKKNKGRRDEIIRGALR